MTKKKSKQKQFKKSQTARTKSAQRRKPLPITLIVCLAIFLFGLIYMIRIESQYVDFGLDRDEAAYALFGETLRSGGAMYKDSYSFKPPAIYYTYAMINTIFGFTPSGLRWSLIMANMLASILLFLLAYRWKGPVFALLAAGAYLFFEFNPYVFGFAAVAEQYQNLLTITALVLIQYGGLKRKWIYFLLGGSVMTYCVLLKQNMVFVYLALAALIGYYYIFESTIRQWKPIFYFIAGSAIASVLIFLPLFIQGTFQDWVYWNITYSSLYVSSVPWESGKEMFSMFGKMVMRFNPWMWYVGMAGILVGLILAKPISAKIGMVLFAIAALLSIVPGLRFYPHYWSYLSPMLAIGCAWAFYSVIKLLSKKVKLHVSQLIVGGLFAVGLVYVVKQNSKFFDDPQELIVMRSLYGDNPFTEARYLGEFLKKRIKPNEEVMLFGSEPEIFNYIERPLSQPDMFFSILIRPHERKEGMIKAMQEWANTHKPKYIFFSNHPYSWGITPGSNPVIYRWAHSFVSQNYKVIAVADIIPQQAPAIVLGEPASTYQLLSEKWVKIYERIGD